MENFQHEVMRSLGRIEEKVDGQKDRIEALEDRNERQEWKDWIKVVVMVPVITLLHAILNKIGVKV
jgi:hypothetical protein